jgi:23S rRNA pseudouridine1911/1915/1917 synthase
MNAGIGMTDVVIPDSLHGQRLDQALTDLTGLSRSRIKALLEEAHIQRNGQPCKASDRASAGETYSVNIPPAAPLSLTPESIALDILYEDAHLIVINKPPGMVVHPSHGHDAGTLVHALLHHCENLPGINGVERPGIVHRLDKDTSGSLVIAKTEAAHRQLTAMFAAHALDRQYLAWCRGVPRWQHKHIESALGRHPQHRQKMAVREDGKPAITDAQLERRYGDDFCRMRLALHTGRTHQIRVHLAHEGIPVLKDATYARSFHPGKGVPEPARSTVSALKRQALHAEILAFAHPVSGEPLRCVAPLPTDLQQLSDALETAYA